MRCCVVLCSTQNAGISDTIFISLKEMNQCEFNAMDSIYTSGGASYDGFKVLYIFDGQLDRMLQRNST